MAIYQGLLVYLRFSADKQFATTLYFTCIYWYGLYICYLTYVSHSVDVSTKEEIWIIRHVNAQRFDYLTHQLWGLKMFYPFWFRVKVNNNIHRQQINYICIYKISRGTRKQLTIFFFFFFLQDCCCLSSNWPVEQFTCVHIFRDNYFDYIVDPVGRYFFN